VGRSGELGSFFTIIFGGPPAFLLLCGVTAELGLVRALQKAIATQRFVDLYEGRVWIFGKKTTYALGGEDLCEFVAPEPRGLPLPDRGARTFEVAEAETEGGGGGGGGTAAFLCGDRRDD